MNRVTWSMVRTSPPPLSPIIPSLDFPGEPHAIKVVNGRTRVPDAFTPSWLRGEPRATALLPLAFRDPEQRRRAVDAAALRPIDPAVHAAIVAQEARRPQSPSRTAALARLAEPGAVAVVTGQQVGLCLGPLYTLHKAAAAVATARALEAETGHPAVAVFWLQTEDADFEEVRTVALPDPVTGAVRRIRITDDLGSQGARVSLSHRFLGAGMNTVLDELANALGGLPHADATLELLRRRYRPQATFGDAFAGVMAELFADEGLLLVDPRDPALAALSVPIHAHAIARAGDIAAALAGRAAALEAAGFKVQVPIREGAALSCFHPGGPDGPRYRLIPDDGHWALAGAEGHVGAKDLQTALQTSPRAFSTTALLRPVLQDIWLPTAAYLGGPGELAYFAQLPPLYEIFERPMPLAVPRARFLIVEPSARRLSRQLAIAPLDAGAPRQDLLAELVARDGDAPVDPEAAIAPVREALAATLAALGKAAADDPGFDRVARKAEEAIEHQLARLAHRVHHVADRSDTVRVARLDRLKNLLWPEDTPQERVYGFPAFAARHGPQALVAALVAAVIPYHSDLVEVDLP
jgi:bacillithiol biosynthesis cysteine-adding enzyme BshC